jgi:hypothetical protein
MGADLPVGSDKSELVGLQPTLLSNFPCGLLIAHIKDWGKPQAAREKAR